MKLASLLFAALALLVAAPCFASEGDVLLDLSPTFSFKDLDGLKQPGVGGQLGIYWAKNDMTDLGLFARFDTNKIKGTDERIKTTSVGIASWLTTFSGDIRPQVGGQIGYGRIEDESYLHLALQARALIEASTRVRLFVGGTGGYLLGDNSVAFIAADVGLQLAFY